MAGNTQYNLGGNYQAIRGLLSRWYNTAAATTTGVALEFTAYQNSSLLSFQIENSGVVIAYGTFGTAGTFNISMHGTAVGDGLGAGTTVNDVAVGGFVLGWIMAQAYPRGWTIAPAKNVNLSDPSAANAFTAVMSSETTGVDLRVAATAFA